MSILPKAEQMPRDEKNQVIGAHRVILPEGEMFVSHEMDTVWFEIGGRRLTMDYPTALQLGRLLTVHGKQAKKFAGDFGTQFLATGVLTNAEENYKKGWR